MPICIVENSVIDNMDCQQEIEKSKRIFCSWTSLPAVSEYEAFLLDGRENVIEKSRVNKPHVSFHGRLLLFRKAYFVQVGNHKQPVFLRGTLVLILRLLCNCHKFTSLGLQANEKN